MLEIDQLVTLEVEVLEFDHALQDRELLEVVVFEIKGLKPWKIQINVLNIVVRGIYFLKHGEPVQQVDVANHVSLQVDLLQVRPVEVFHELESLKVKPS